MPYIPDTLVENTTIPRSYSRDLQLAVRLIEERYSLFKPPLEYYSLQVLQTKVTDLNIIAGEAGSTAFDPLWGESVDPAMRGQPWTQPHLSGTFEADDLQADVFADPILINANVRREALDTELKRWGFDRVRGLIVTIPLSLYDKAGIEVHVGDKFKWWDDEYDLLQWTMDGYWKNTSQALYAILNCDSRRRGN